MSARRNWTVRWIRGEWHIRKLYRPKRAAAPMSKSAAVLFCRGINGLPMPDRKSMGEFLLTPAEPPPKVPRGRWGGRWGHWKTLHGHGPKSKAVPQ